MDWNTWRKCWGLISQGSVFIHLTDAEPAFFTQFFLIRHACFLKSCYFWCQVRAVCVQAANSAHSFGWAALRLSVAQISCPQIKVAVCIVGWQVFFTLLWDVCRLKIRSHLYGLHRLEIFVNVIPSPSVISQCDFHAYKIYYFLLCYLDYFSSIMFDKIRQM